MLRQIRSSEIINLITNLQQLAMAENHIIYTESLVNNFFDDFFSLKLLPHLELWAIILTPMTAYIHRQTDILLLFLYSLSRKK